MVFPGHWLPIPDHWLPYPGQGLWQFLTFDNRSCSIKKHVETIWKWHGFNLYMRNLGSIVEFIQVSSPHDPVVHMFSTHPSSFIHPAKMQRQLKSNYKYRKWSWAWRTSDSKYQFYIVTLPSKATAFWKHQALFDHSFDWTQQTHLRIWFTRTFEWTNTLETY